MKKTIMPVIVLLIFSTTIWAAPGGTRAFLPFMQLTGEPAQPAKADPPQVGEQLTFWGWDLSVMPPTNRQFTATCRGVSDFGYVFVEDAQWNVAMDQTDVDAVAAAWDEESPAGSIDPDGGIYDIETSLFGAPPDVDGWPGVVLLYYELGCFMGQCFDGFYRYDDQLAGPTSNRMDMLHLEATQQDPGEAYMLGVTAHEFNHMLQMVHDLVEETWLSEALAEAAMVVAGYPTDLAWLDDFIADPTVTFLGDDTTVHYGAALLLGTYLYETGGAELLQAVTADVNDGADSVEDQLAALGQAESFAAWFGDLAAAVAADHFVDQGAADADGRFHFALLEVGELAWDDEIEDAPNKYTWECKITDGSMNALFIDLTGGAAGMQLGLDNASANGLEGAVAVVGPQALQVTRFNAASADWPNPSIGLAGAEAAIVVVANPFAGEMETAVTVAFDYSPADDDDSSSDDDDAAPADDDDDHDIDDDNDDDNAPDDDDQHGDADDDDDDNDDGCGC